MTQLQQPTSELIAVCLCTYKRPSQLGRALDSLTSIARPPSTVFVVVDNDGSDPDVERHVQRFRASSGARVEYVIESSSGISAARNAAIKTARSLGARAVAMLDDDEWATPDWLMKLVEMRKASGAGVVGGPVHPVFPAHRKKLEPYATLWSVREGRLRGRVYVYCTCNCLVDLHAASILGDSPFDPNFGLTGGEDSVFFRRLFFAGVRMAWCEDALLYEEVNDERATIAWMRRRWYRQGNVGVRCERAAPGPGDMPALLKTAFLLVRFPIYPILNSRVFAAPLLWLLEFDRLRGRVACHFGMTVAQYRRPVAADD
jgi:succinoglycan biosynthesis protein ExoM